MIYAFILRPILHAIYAFIGEELAADRWVDKGFAPVFYVLIPVATIAVALWAVTS